MALLGNNGENETIGALDHALDALEISLQQSVAELERSLAARATQNQIERAGQAALEQTAAFYTVLLQRIAEQERAHLLTSADAATAHEAFMDQYVQEVAALGARAHAAIEEKA